MNIKRFQQYLERRKSNLPLLPESHVKKSSDKKMDEDFPGYPHGQSTKEIIKPETRTQKKTAALNVKDGEKQFKSTSRKRKETDEQDSDGSGGAFGGSEEVRE